MRVILPKLNFCQRCYSMNVSKPVVLSTVSFKNNAVAPINKTLLITHGLLGSKQNWNSICKKLKSEFKEVVAIDLRNHGESPHTNEMTLEAMAADIKLLIKSGNYKDPVMMGHSLGGRVAMLLALTEPQLLSSLVVVDISPFSEVVDRSMKEYPALMKEAPINQHLSLADNRRIIDGYLAPHLQDISLRNFLLTNLCKTETGRICWRPNLQMLIDNYHIFFRFSAPPNSVFRCPTLFIGGQNSDYIKLEHWPYVQEYFPSASLRMIPGAGHWVHADKPVEFCDTLIDFCLRNGETE